MTGPTPGDTTMTGPTPEDTAMTGPTQGRRDDEPANAGRAAINDQHPSAAMSVHLAAPVARPAAGKRARLSTRPSA